MSQRTLQFWEREGRSTTFFDPLNIDNKLTHMVELLKKPVGKERLRQPRVTFVQGRQYSHKSCEQDTCGTKTSETAKVVLSGTSPEQLQQLWTDIKANVDAAILAGALTGVPSGIGSNHFLIDVGVV